MASDRFAEYQTSAPEVAPTPPPAPVAPPPVSVAGEDILLAKQVVQPEKEIVPPDDLEKGSTKKTFLGLTSRALLIIAILIILITVGVVVGAVLGTRGKQSDRSSETSIPTSISSATAAGASTASLTASRTASSTASASSTPTSLSIIQAIYAATDVTTKAQAVIQNGDNLSIDMSNTAAWAGGDPWYGVKKCLSILHSYGSSIRTFVACEGNGTFTLVPGDVGLSARTQEITRQGPSSSDFAIVSAVWGAAEIRDTTVYQAIYDYKRNGTQIPFNNVLFGKDTYYGEQKSGVIWYTQDNFKTFKSIYGRESSTASF